MRFNFKEILEMFSGHWRFLSLLVLVGAMVGAFVFVPVAQSYFGSERQSCGKCLDENNKLLHRIIEISALVREYEYMKAMEEDLNRQVLNEMRIESDTSVDIQQPTYTNMAVEQNKIIDIGKDSIISKINELSKIE